MDSSQSQRTQLIPSFLYTCGLPRCFFGTLDSGLRCQGVYRHDGAEVPAVGQEFFLYTSALLIMFDSSIAFSLKWSQHLFFFI
jgi:hypothetical protein